MNETIPEDLPSPEPNYSYVCWMDIMGTGNKMYRNISNAARDLLVFQILCKDSENPNITVYPMMDGIYIAAETVEGMKEFIDESFKKAANLALETSVENLFVIRAGVSFGPIVEGRDFQLPDDDFSESANSLLIGPPMVEAYSIEEKAPPFGVAVHDSARAFTQNDFEYLWYEWFDPDDRRLANNLRKALNSYFEFYEANSHKTDYKQEKIDAHKNTARQYFPEIKLKDK